MHSPEIQTKVEVKSSRALIFISISLILFFAYALFLSGNNKMSMGERIFIQFLAIFFLYGYLILSHYDIIYNQNQITIYNVPTFQSKTIDLQNIISVEGAVAKGWFMVIFIRNNVVRITFSEQNKKHIAYVSHPDVDNLENLKLNLLAKGVKVNWDIFYTKNTPKP